MEQRERHHPVFPRRTTAGAVAIILASAALACGPEREAPSAADVSGSAAELLGSAVARMGGAAALRGIRRTRARVLTQWVRLNYAGGPYDDQPSYELSTDVRDYTLDAWRHTREFPSFGSQRVVDLVKGDVAVRDAGSGFRPLNIAYVDERSELFAYTPDRLLLGLLAADSLRALPDTVLYDREFGRIEGVVEDRTMRLHFDRHTDLPSMVSFFAAHPNDFGLVPRGEMRVRVWYSGWRALPGGVHWPAQWAIERSDQLYKRLTFWDITLNPEFEADSFAIARVLEEEYRATATQPMHDVPLDSARVDGDFAVFGAFGSPIGAVRSAAGWVLLESGQAPLSYLRAVRWLQETSGIPVGRVALTTTFGNGGVAAAFGEPMRAWAGPAVADHVRMVLANHGIDPDEASLDVVDGKGWIDLAGDSIHVSRVDFVDAPGRLLLYVPRLSWVYSHDMRHPVDFQLVRETAEGYGWTVVRYGNARGLNQEFPPE